MGRHRTQRQFNPEEVALDYFSTKQTWREFVKKYRISDTWMGVILEKGSTQILESCRTTVDDTLEVVLSRGIALGKSPEMLKRVYRYLFIRRRKRSVISHLYGG